MTPLSPEVQAELAKLHDIRLPAPVGWWPLAPGWWGLLTVVLLAIIGAVMFEIHRRRGLRFAALRELAALKSSLPTASAPDIARDLAVLLRRVTLADPAMKPIAMLSGPDWETALTQGRGGFSAPIAAYLSAAPYAPARDTDQTLLTRAMAEAEIWIRRR